VSNKKIVLDDITEESTQRNRAFKAQDHHNDDINDNVDAPISIPVNKEKSTKQFKSIKKFILPDSFYAIRIQRILRRFKKLNQQCKPETDKVFTILLRISLITRIIILIMVILIRLKLLLKLVIFILIQKLIKIISLVTRNMITMVNIKMDLNKVLVFKYGKMELLIKECLIYIKLMD
jgi:hypothetical protein